MSQNINKLIVINFCSRFHLYIHVYALLLGSRGLSLLQISTIESVVIATLFLMEVQTGVIADRIPRRWSVTASLFLMMSAEALFLFSRSYPLYLLVAVFTGTGFAFASGAVESLIYDSLPADNRDAEMKRVMGRYGSIGQIAFFLSPIVGSFIIGDMAPERFNIAIALTVLALFVGVAVSLTLHEPQALHTKRQTNSLSILRQGWRELYHNPPMQRLALMTIFTATFTGALVTTYAAFYMSKHNLSPLAIALALSIGSLLAAVTQHSAYRIERWLGKRWSLLLLTLLPGISYLVLAFSTAPYLIWFIIVWMYATNDTRVPLISAYQNALISSENRATTLSLVNMFLNIFVAVMGPIYATLGTINFAFAFIAMGLVILFAGITLRVEPLPGKAKM
ncbi:MAG: MFS transporter [Anaerolineaceae bacterium]|nr:MFS transporter [Anaerolineaceae bacterium]